MVGLGFGINRGVDRIKGGGQRFCCLSFFGLVVRIILEKGEIVNINSYT